MLGSKFPKFLSVLKQQISFSSNFSSIFSVMRHNSSVLFLVEILYTFNKRSKFGEIESLKFGTFMGSFCQNNIKFQPKGTEELSLLTLTSDAKFKEKLTCSFKYDMRNFLNFHPTIQKSESSTLTVYFCLKYI